MSRADALARLRPDRLADRPGAVLLTGFGALILAGTALLLTPLAWSGPGHAAPLTALFTSTSAACVTGLTVVDTGTSWSPFGQVVILVLMHLGGFGVMTTASLLTLVVVGRLGVRSRMLAGSESATTSFDGGTVRRVLRGSAKVSLLVEVVASAVIALRLWWGYDYPAGRALWYGVFHGVSAFNNAGFSLWSDNLVSVGTDPWIVLPIAAALVIGGLGYPVVLEVLRQRRPRTLSVHTRLTLLGTALLLVAGPVLVLLGEWRNPGTLGQLDLPGKLLSGWFSGVTPRTAGFNSIDYGAATPGTLLVTDVLMVVGGGSAGTAGGIKITTVAVLALAVLAEVRGDRDVDVMHRRIPQDTLRQAIAVAGLAMAAVVGACLVLLEISGQTLDEVLFEVCSAFGTSGLSTGITPDLPPLGHLVLVGLMFLGRTGTVTLATALALRRRPRGFRNPEGRPIVG